MGERRRFVFARGKGRGLLGGSELDWANESYVKIYTRDTAAWLALPWQARAVFYELVRKVDRSGVLKVGRKGVGALPACLNMPSAVIQVGINALIEEGAVLDKEDRIVIPDHTEAQEKRASDASRQRDSRLRRKEIALASGASEEGARAAARPDRYGPRASTSENEPSEKTDAGHTGHTAGHTGHTDDSRVTARVTLRVEKSREDKGREEKIREDPPTAPQGGRSRSRGRAAITPEAKRATVAVIEAYNRCFERKLGADGWEKGIQKLLSAGYTEEQIRGVVWWAADEWADDPVMRDKVSPATLLKLQSSQGYRTFPQYLSCAAERWRDTHHGEAPPWERTAQPELQLVAGEGA
jgi:hypothetical protein